MTPFIIGSGSAVLRCLLPVLAVLLLIRLGRGLLFYRDMREIWAWLILPDGKRLPVTHWENTLGSAKSCDVCLNGKGVAKIHAVLTRSDDGQWTVTDADSKGGVKVANRKVKVSPVKYGQSITLGGCKVTLEPINAEQERAQAEYRQKSGTKIRSGFTLLLLTAFQVLLTASLLQNIPRGEIVLASAVLVAMEWALFFFYRIIRRKGFEIETAAFFLCSLGQAVLASSAPQELIKQTLCTALGVGLFLLVGWCLRDLRRSKRMRYAAAAAGLGLLLVTLLFAQEVNGARNWVFFGGISVQPSELVKVCFVFVGASALDRLVTRRNLWLFILYSGAVCVCLALNSDFGSALVFFVAFLVISYLRSGDFATLSLLSAGTAFAAVLAAKFLPYVKRRFAAWRHVWEFAQTGGYQQTRSMMCIASGGLLGLGAGEGWLKHVAAADTDLVFALLAEEHGLVMSLCAVAAVVLLSLFAIRSSALCRSSFHVIGAVSAVSILLTQTILNVFGTVDLLPLTGVTFPFLSNGGTSMIAAWGLLAFLKSADTRQNASFTIRLPGRKKK